MAKIRKLKKIYVHHSESKSSATVQEIRRWHLQRGFSDIGYHYIIEEAGNIEKGRDVSCIGAGVKGDNAESIHVCVTGNFDIYKPKRKQLISLGSLLKELCSQYKIDPININGHCDYKGVTKTCPGKNLYVEVLRFKERLSRQIHRGNFSFIDYILDRIFGR